MKPLALLLVLFAAAPGSAQTFTPGQAEAIRIYAAAKPYMDRPVADLKAAIDALDGLHPDDSQIAAELLQKVGEVIAAQMPRIPNLVAREDISEEVTASPIFLSPNRRIPLSLDRFTHGGFMPTNWRHYEFVVRTVHHPPDVTEFLESRKDLAKKPLDIRVHGTGFGSLWLIFVPSNLPHSNFRYLGRQKIHGAETFVVAFAENPEKVPYPGIIDDPRGKMPLLLQGIVWIDQQTSRIHRIRTDLLMPLPDINIDNLNSTIDFKEVRIPNFTDPLWLPSQVEITWKSNNVSAGELHHYSNYQLFRSTVRILPD